MRLRKVILRRVKGEKRFADVLGLESSTDTLCGVVIDASVRDKTEQKEDHIPDVSLDSNFIVGGNSSSSNEYFYGVPQKHRISRCSTNL